MLLLKASKQQTASTVKPTHLYYCFVLSPYFSPYFRYFLKKFDRCLPIVVINQSGNCVSSSIIITRNPRNFKFYRIFDAYFINIFANSCKLVLLPPFLVMTEVAKLSVFKCIEVFCNKGAKYLNAYSITNNYLQVDESKLSFIVRFL